jgi:Flp pilus assembly pilin Flp
MKKESKKSVRGASMVEYALLLVAVTLLSAAAFKSLGPKISDSARNTETTLEAQGQ